MPIDAVFELLGIRKHLSEGSKLRNKKEKEKSRDTPEIAKLGRNATNLYFSHPNCVPPEINHGNKTSSQIAKSPRTATKSLLEHTLTSTPTSSLTIPGAGNESCNSFTDAKFLSKCNKSRISHDKRKLWVVRKASSSILDMCPCGVNEGDFG